MDSMVSHHAVLYSVAQPLSYAYEGEPEVVFKQPQFGIDLARALIETAYRRPAEGSSERLVVVATEFITEEAQQALLKIIEEPPVSTKFVFILRDGYTLLPTLESRFFRQSSEVSCDGGEGEVFQTFMTLSYRERLSLIEESIKKKDDTWQKALKQGLVQYLKTNRGTLPTVQLKELEYCARLLLTRGVSNKFLFEHLALVLTA
jgi:hypothetical protein